LTKRDVDEVAVPVQVLAPELDRSAKIYTFQVLQKRNVLFNYQHFPGVEHACCIRSDAKKGENARLWQWEIRLLFLG
jgi:hypothetical protein